MIPSILQMQPGNDPFQLGMSMIPGVNAPLAPTPVAPVMQSTPPPGGVGTSPSGAQAPLGGGTPMGGGLPSQNPGAYGLMTPKQASWAATAQNIGNIVSSGGYYRPQLQDPATAGQIAAASILNADMRAQQQQRQAAELAAQQEEAAREAAGRAALIRAVPEAEQWVNAGVPVKDVYSTMTKQQQALADREWDVEMQNMKHGQAVALAQEKARLSPAQDKGQIGITRDPRTGQVIQSVILPSGQVAIPTQEGLQPVPPDSGYITTPAGSASAAPVFEQIAPTRQTDLAEQDAQLTGALETVGVAEELLESGAFPPRGVGAIVNMVNEVKGIGRDLGQWLSSTGAGADVQQAARDASAGKIPKSPSGRLKMLMIGLSYDVARASQGAGVLSDQDFKNNVARISAMSTPELRARLDELRNEAQRKKSQVQQERQRAQFRREAMVSGTPQQWLTGSLGQPAGPLSSPLMGPQAPQGQPVVSDDELDTSLKEFGY